MGKHMRGNPDRGYAGDRIITGDDEIKSEGPEGKRDISGKGDKAKNGRTARAYSSASCTLKKGCE